MWNLQPNKNVTTSGTRRTVLTGPVSDKLFPFVVPGDRVQYGQRQTATVEALDLLPLIDSPRGGNPLALVHSIVALVKSQPFPNQAKRKAKKLEAFSLNSFSAVPQTSLSLSLSSKSALCSKPVVPISRSTRLHTNRSHRVGQATALPHGLYFCPVVPVHEID